jgi:hypothetical protein
VIAASDAPANVKAQADYVCDGVADNVEIQAAIDTGKNVMLLEGTFNIATTITLATTYQTLNGSGYATILKPITNFNSTVVVLGANYTNIENLQIDGNKANQNTSGYGLTSTYRYTRCRGILIKDVKNSGIKLMLGGGGGTASDGLIYEVRVTGCGGVGLELESANGGFIVNGYYADSCAVGLRVATTWANIGNFRITGCSTDGVQVDAPVGGNAWHIVFNNGDVDGNDNHGFNLYASAGNIYGVEIGSVTFGDNSGGTDNTYSSIYCHRDGAYGLNGLNFHDNYFYEPSAKYILEAANTTGTFHNNYIGLAGHGKVSATGFKYKENYGYVTESTVQSATFDISSTGQKNLTIAHGLDVTPATCDIAATIQQANIFDFVVNVLDVHAADATNVTVIVYIGTASGTPGKTATVSLNIQAGGW